MSSPELEHVTPLTQPYRQATGRASGFHLQDDTILASTVPATISESRELILDLVVSVFLLNSITSRWAFSKNELSDRL